MTPSNYIPTTMPSPIKQINVIRHVVVDSALNKWYAIECNDNVYRYIRDTIDGNNMRLVGEGWFRQTLWISQAAYLQVMLRFPDE